MLTNKNKISELMVDVFDDKPYIPAGTADYSATSMIDPPRLVILKKRYGDQVVDDVMDRWNIFLGNAVHEKIEKELGNFPTRYILERKFTEVVNGKKIVAKIDAYDTETDTLYDHKTCKVFAWSNEPKKEWEEQLNINIWFLRKAGFEPVRACINALMLDWLPGMAKFKGPEEYPQVPMCEFEIPIWTFDEQEAFIINKLDVLSEAESLDDDSLPLCSDAEMWAKPDTYAVKKEGVYVAKRVLPTMKEAEEWIARQRNFRELYIEPRPGERVRCANYCKVKAFCSQYKEYCGGK